jgi:sugar/nucleoside kinase (ribokinase family)
MAIDAENEGGRSAQVDVVGVGPVTWDRFLELPRLPLAEDRLRAIRAEEAAGGALAAALTALTRWRLKCRLVSVIGYDDASKRILDDLAHEGVQTDALVRREDAEGRSRVVLVDHRNGSRCILWWPHPPCAVEPAMLRENWFDGARLLLLDTSMHACAAEAVRAARARSMRVAVALGEGADRAVLDLLRQADLVVADRDTASEFTNQPDAAQAAYVLHLTTDAPTIVTCGPGGAYYVQGRETIHQPAYKVPVVDQTGAGALFQAGFLYGLLAALDTHRALKLAAWAAAMVCREIGCRKGVPTDLQIKQFLHEV